MVIVASGLVIFVAIPRIISLFAPDAVGTVCIALTVKKATA